MFSIAALALVTLATSANALVIPRSTPPATYAVGYLEDYTTYHIRYLALNCQTQHSTQFFDDCCHPMLATENLKDDRKAYCTPSATASSSASAIEPTSTVKPDDGDDDCTDDDEDSSVANPAPTAAPTKNDSPAPPENVAAPPPSSSEKKPEPTSSEKKPEPSSSAKPEPSSSKSAAPKPSSSPSNSGGLSGIIGNIFSGGIATFFFQNGVAGACGTVHQDSDFVVALETSTYANGAHCGKKVILKDATTGHTETATVADECPTCNDANSVDLSHGLFNKFATDGDGVFKLTWGFVNDN